MDCSSKIKEKIPTFCRFKMKMRKIPLGNKPDRDFWQIMRIADVGTVIISQHPKNPEKPSIKKTWSLICGEMREDMSAKVCYYRDEKLTENIIYHTSILQVVDQPEIVWETSWFDKIKKNGTISKRWLWF